MEKCAKIFQILQIIHLFFDQNEQIKDNYTLEIFPSNANALLSVSSL